MFKKLMALVISVAMIFGTSAVVFAAEDGQADNGTTSIKERVEAQKEAQAEKQKEMLNKVAANQKKAEAKKNSINAASENVADQDKAKLMEDSECGTKENPFQYYGVEEDDRIYYECEDIESVMLPESWHAINVEKDNQILYLNVYDDDEIINSVQLYKDDVVVKTLTATTDEDGYKFFICNDYVADSGVYMVRVSFDEDRDDWNYSNVFGVSYDNKGTGSKDNPIQVSLEPDENGYYDSIQNRWDGPWDSMDVWFSVVVPCDDSKFSFNFDNEDGRISGAELYKGSQDNKIADFIEASDSDEYLTTRYFKGDAGDVFYVKLVKNVSSGDNCFALYAYVDDYYGEGTKESPYAIKPVDDDEYSTEYDEYATYAAGQEVWYKFVADKAGYFASDIYEEIGLLKAEVCDGEYNTVESYRKTLYDDGENEGFVTDFYLKQGDTVLLKVTLLKDHNEGLHLNFFKNWPYMYLTKYPTSFTYTGKTIKPGYIVLDCAGNTLVKDRDFTVTYSNNINVGKGKITAKFIGKYSGFESLYIYYSIIPKGTTLRSVSAGRKAFTVKWNKQAAKMKTSTISGYQIQYSTSSKFATGNKTVTVKGYKTTSKTIKSLKAKKKYYVRIRTYKTVSGTKYYSSWSAKKYVTTKK